MGAKSFGQTLNARRGPRCIQIKWIKLKSDTKQFDSLTRPKKQNVAGLALASFATLMPGVGFVGYKGWHVPGYSTLRCFSTSLSAYFRSVLPCMRMRCAVVGCRHYSGNEIATPAVCSIQRLNRHRHTIQSSLGKCHLGLAYCDSTMATPQYGYASMR